MIYFRWDRILMLSSQMEEFFVFHSKSTDRGERVCKSKKFRKNNFFFQKIQYDISQIYPLLHQTLCEFCNKKIDFLVLFVWNFRGNHRFSVLQNIKIRPNRGE